MTLLSLRTGRLAVDLAPSAGGAIARFAVGDRDVLRPMAEADRHSGRGNNGSAYPLVPFSNRIKDGRLVFDGKTIELKRNWPGVNHPMHGDGWSHAWQVVRADSQSAEIVYEHVRDGENGGWPFRYRAHQSYRLDADCLSMTMTLENLEDHAVPAGIGLHPFFLRDADTELQTRTDFMWTSDAETLPVERIATPAEADFTRARNVNETRLDNGFDGWARHATIRWPQAGLQLDLEASAVFGHAVIYVPPGRPYFCIEPVSHANGKVGNAPLGAGATLSGEIAFRISEKQK